jgi:hypothetical protein
MAPSFFFQMLARTVSGVFDKLKSLPSLPGEVISGIRGPRENTTERKDSAGNDTDVDNISVQLDYAQDLVGVDVIFLLKNSRTCSLLKKQLYVEKKT